MGYYFLFAVVVFLIVFVSPILLTVVYHRIRTSDFLSGEVVHPSPTGWDWFFGQAPRRNWILFHMKSGEVVGGFYGERSSASSYPTPQQVYVEEV